MLTVICNARMEGHITGKTGAPEAEIDEKQTDNKIVKAPNPAYEEWFALDQQVLGLIFTSVGKMSSCRLLLQRRQ